MSGTLAEYIERKDALNVRIGKAEKAFQKMFGFEPTFYGSVEEYADLLDESLATGEPQLMEYDPHVLL